MASLSLGWNIHLSYGLVVELECGQENKDGVLELGMEGLVGELSVHEDAEGGEGDTAGQTVGLLLASLQQHTNHLVLNIRITTQFLRKKIELSYLYEGTVKEKSEEKYR
jgi:hypothetical protein